MPLDAERSRIWEALGIGPQWIERGAEDPLLPSGTRASAAPVSAPAPAPVPPRPAPFRSPEPSGRAQPAAAAAVAAPQARQAAAPAPAPAASGPSAHEKALAIFEGIESATWEELARRVPLCEACGLAKTRIRTVFADGAPGCPLVMVGEAPGAEEDMQGKPFVGKSGQLLTNALEAVGIERGRDAAIVNVLKCRPPHNRDPLPGEVTLCRHFLDRQLELLAPKALVLMGRPAASTVLGTDLSIARLRGVVHEVEIGGRRVPAIVTYHPSYLLRSLTEKEKFWHDLLAAKRLLAAA
ncbi:uracil-DNA glycosylase [Mesosutterella sp. OilRF-GAM-744-9]|uniref:Type-4 uracil-DNA glycosylase n=1 Tax=Mesosutterella porci TaxID=2915351 RepID=A0ABS9MQN4_9BURK|nr:uracil-DNA glycosylase [Mesosutterella sp. oilRF-744-WT-GAM-9]MCG5030842.1 uracil-DNA glycosylase [Mesosutterella sp. oilRF-744-WT-GAM-9]